MIVTAMDAAPGSVVSGTDKCPAYALCNLNTSKEAPPPAPTDNFAAKSPPPLNLPRTWTLGAPAPSEDLGTPQSSADDDEGEEDEEKATAEERLAEGLDEVDLLLVKAFTRSASSRRLLRMANWPRRSRL